MSRVHDAMRRAGQTPEREIVSTVPPEAVPNGKIRNGAAVAEPERLTLNLPSLVSKFEEHPFNPAPESHLIDLHRPMETPSEEFRSLRTKLNYMQTLQSLHTVVVTSASPAEGKSFTAMNLALAESHLADNSVLIADFDLRRPTLHNLLQLDRSPGISDYLLGEAPLEKVIRRITGSNLYFIAAGKPVKNPLELLNLREVKVLLDELHTVFNWTFFDTPPLLFSADADDRRHHPGSPDRLDDDRYDFARGAISQREQRSRRGRQRRQSGRAVQQIHVLLFEERRSLARP